MRRKTFIRSLTAASLAMLAGAARADKSVLRFAWWGGSDRHERTLKVIAAFEARHPDVKIKPEYMGFNGYPEKMTMQMVGRTEPDIMQMAWPAIAQFSRQGDGFYDLQRQKHLIDLSQFSDTDLRLCSVNGKLNGLPSSYTARIFLWNKATYARAGLPMPGTWDELFAAGRLLKAKLGERAYAIDGEPYDMLLLAQTYVFQKHGTPYVHPTEPRVAMSPAALLDWVQTYKRLADSGAATPLKFRASLGGPEKPLEQQPDWVVGNWAGNFTWDSALRLRLNTLDRHQELDIGEFLTLPGAKNSGMFGRPTMVLAVSKHTRQPELAARFLNYFLTDPEAARILSVTRGVPAAASAYRTLEEEKLISPLEHKAFLQIKQLRDAGRIDLPSPRFEDARFRRFLREVFELVSYDRISDQEAARRLLEDGNTLLARIK